MFARRPKFKFEFAINDLSNIPHTSGYCYVDVVVGDGHQSGFRAAISSLKPVTKTAQLATEETAKLTRSTPGDSATAKSTSTSGNVHVRTSRRKIHNFRCSFNFRMTCNLRFTLRKRDSMVGPKFLVLRVYYVADKSKSQHNHTELGVVKLNLSEYLNFHEPVTTKYLLQESKINLILGLTLSLDELPADYEFHTQLRIEDSKHGTSSQSLSKPSESSSRVFNVPQLQRQTVFGGLDGVINNGLSKQTESDEDAHRQEERDTALDEGAKIGSGAFDNVVVDPIISKLYRKVLESTWDPELHCLLKWSPERIVDDIFKASGEGCREEWKQDVEKYALANRDDEDGFKDMNGLISETKYRDNLRSWTVSWT